MGNKRIFTLIHMTMSLSTVGWGKVEVQRLAKHIPLTGYQAYWQTHFKYGHCHHLKNHFTQCMQGLICILGLCITIVDSVGDV